MKSMANANVVEKGKNPPYLRIGIYSLLVNLSLVAVKLTLSFITGSLALRADAIHSSVDVFGSLALIAGLIIANRKSSKFPYGLYKVENVVTLVIAVLLFVTAYEIVRNAIEGGTAFPTYSGWVLGVVAVIILVPFIFSRYEIAAGKRYNSPSLIADGKQFRADILSASIVFFALLGEYFGLPLDRIAAGIVALFIAYSGWGLLSGSMRVLLDASVDSETLSKIRLVIESEPAVSSIEHITGRNSGRYIFVEINITLKVDDLVKAHQISERLEKKIKEAECCIDRVLIHYEPERKEKIRYAIALSKDKEQVSPHFGDAPYFMLVDVDSAQKTVVKRQRLDNPHAGKAHGKGLEVARFLLDYKPDVVLTREDISTRGPGYAFADAGVITVQTDVVRLEALVNGLLADIGKRRGE